MCVCVCVCGCMWIWVGGFDTNNMEKMDGLGVDGLGIVGGTNTQNGMLHLIR